MSSFSTIEDAVELGGRILSSVFDSAAEFVQNSMEGGFAFKYQVLDTPLARSKHFQHLHSFNWLDLDDVNQCGYSWTMVLQRRSCRESSGLRFISGKCMHQRPDSHEAE